MGNIRFTKVESRRPDNFTAPGAKSYRQGDCVTQSLCRTLDVPYAEVWHTVTAYKKLQNGRARSADSGVMVTVFRKMMAELGIESVPKEDDFVLYRKTLLSVAALRISRHALVCLTDHMVNIKDYGVEDRLRSKSKTKRVIEFWPIHDLDAFKAAWSKLVERLRVQVETNEKPVSTQPVRHAKTGKIAALVELATPMIEAGRYSRSYIVDNVYIALLLSDDHPTVARATVVKQIGNARLHDPRENRFRRVAIEEHGIMKFTDITI